MKKIFGAIILCTFFYSYGSERTFVEPSQVPQSPKNDFIKINLNPNQGIEQQRLPFANGFSPRDGIHHIKKRTKK